MTTAEAQARFYEFNERYFDGKLPRYRVHVEHRQMTRFRAVGVCLRKQRLIKLAAGDPDEEQQRTLLHEMAHAATNDHHAAKFQAEMLRLQAVGAPVSVLDVDPKRRVIRKARITQGDIRKLAEDFCLDGKTRALRQFLRWVVYENGYEQTQAGFQRRYPWVSRVFREVKKDAREYSKRVAQIRKEVTAD